MCGIIGYTGHSAAAPILLDGLRRLEYRGYDSAGLALVGAGTLTEIKEVGKVARLEEACAGFPELENDVCCGIAHTRWATHGVPLGGQCSFRTAMRSMSSRLCTTASSRTITNCGRIWR